MGLKLRQIVIKTCRSRITIIAVTLIVVYTLTGFFLLPYLIERFLPGMLSQRLNSDVQLRQVKINPFALTLEAREFQINETSGNGMAAFQRLFINFQAGSLFRWALTFADITLDEPSVNAVIDRDGKLNLARLAGHEPSPPTEKKGELLRILLQTIQVNNAKISVTDKRQPGPAAVSLSPLNIQFSDISTLPEREGRYKLMATISDGSTLQCSGQVSLVPLRSQGSMEIKQASLATVWKFARSHLNILPPRGHVSLKGGYLINLGNSAPVVTLNDFNVRVADIRVQIEDSEKALLTLPEVNLDTGKVDINKRTIDDVRLSILGGELNLINEKEGILNVQRLAGGSKEPVPPSSGPHPEGETWSIHMSRFSLEGLGVNYSDQYISPTTAFSASEVNLSFGAAVTVHSPDVGGQVNDLLLTLRKIAAGIADTPHPAIQVDELTVAGAIDLGARSASISRVELKDGMIDVIRNNDSTINLTRLSPGKKPSSDAPGGETREGKSAPWQFLAETISLSGFKTRFTDLSVNPDNALIDLQNINLTVSRFDGKSPSPFDMGLSVTQGGEMKASGNFDPSGRTVESTVALKDLALPSLQPYISPIADLTLNSGLFSTRGRFHRAAEGRMTYQGEAGIAGLQIIENSTRDIMMGWQQLEMPDLSLSLNPNRVEIDTVKLGGLEGKLFISEDRKVNVVEAFKPKGPPSTDIQQMKPAPDASGTTFPVRIGKLSLDKGMLNFADFSLRPNFETNIHELKGTVTGISSSPGSRTMVELDGRVDQYGTSRISGEINVFDPEQLTDMAMVFRNLEMTNLTPYSGRFAGRKIDSGKLSLDLHYRVENRQLAGDNKIIIDKLKLGEKVESPGAVNLPLDLALALLKDSKGVIDIDLTVSGNLDDPEFSYGSLIWKALVNLLTKVITSPFRALGSLLGGGEEILNAVNFESGSSMVPPPEQEKLAKLTDALNQRPQLKLTVTGRYHKTSDAVAIKQLQIRRAFAEASGQPLKPGEDPGPVDFSNPDSHQKLAGLFVKRYGQEAYEKLIAETGPSKKPADSEKASGDPGEIARSLFSELIKREPMEEALLKELADKRGQAIVSQLSAGGIPPERLVIKPSESTDSEEPISATLGLDAMAP